MNSADRERLETAHRVLRDLRSKDFRNATADTAASGERVVVPALPTDTMAYLFGQVRKARGPIHVAVRVAASSYIMTMEPYKPKHARELPDGDDQCGISFCTELGMVIEYLKARNRPVFLYESRPSVALKLVDDDALADTIA